MSRDNLRPFRFEDLNGKPEPDHWGPVYPALPTVEKWRKLARKRALTADEERAYGQAVHSAIRALNAPSPRQGLNTKSACASGQAGDYSAAKHRAKIRTELAAAAARDRSAWAEGKPKYGRFETIVEAYKAAMRDKRAREEALLDLAA
jgi:hypothetical protein